MLGPDTGGRDAGQHHFSFFAHCFVFFLSRSNVCWRSAGLPRLITQRRHRHKCLILSEKRIVSEVGEAERVRPPLLGCHGKTGTPLVFMGGGVNEYFL